MTVITTIAEGALSVCCFHGIGLVWGNIISCMYENDNMENAEESLYIAISNGDLDKALQFIANGLFD